MQSALFADLIDKLIPLLGGIWCTLVGYRVIGYRPWERISTEAKYTRNEMIMRIAGPVMLIYGLTATAGVLIRSALPPSLPKNLKWTRYTSSDRTCSIEFPQRPRHEVRDVANSQLDSLTLHIQPIDAYYTLTFSEVPEQIADATEQELLGMIRDLILTAKTPDGTALQLTKEVDIANGNRKGREIEYRMGDRIISRAIIFVSDGYIYRAIAANPNSKELDEAANRFLRSFQFEKQ